MTDSSIAPDLLSHDPGVRRLNRLPLVIVGLLGLMILAAITYTYQMRLADMRDQAAASDGKPSAASPSEVFQDAPDGGLIPANRQMLTPPPPPAVKIETPALPNAETEAEERLRQQREQLAQARLAANLQAIKAPTAVARAQATVKPASTAPLPADGNGANGHSAAYAEALRRRMLRGDAPEDIDINHAAEKAAWLQDRNPQGREAHYLSGGREMPISRYEIKAGTIIPATMISGVNSDLPGQLLAQVRENIFDSASGRYILIPQGSKLIGTYDNAITSGQERVLVAWTRIIYPDGSSLDLGKMPGADAAGFAGLKDRVDNHFWKAFGNALLMSVFSAGVQVSQGGQNNGGGGLTAQQTIAAGLGQQLGQLGQEMARRNVQVQPTIEIRQGLTFTVMVTKDAVISPWRPKQTAME
jgi:type IV secretion system protein TrbI